MINDLEKSASLDEMTMTQLCGLRKSKREQSKVNICLAEGKGHNGMLEQRTIRKGR
jgi:hypothetical protein